MCIASALLWYFILQLNEFLFAEFSCLKLDLVSTKKKKKGTCNVSKIALS